MDLRANTSVKVVVGAAVAVADGFTPVTTLTLSGADEAELMKHDASAVTSISGNTIAAITGMDGYYNVTLTTGNVDTEGMLVLAINDDSLILPIRHVFNVMGEDAYDAKYNDGTGAVARQAIIDSGTAQSATGTTLVLRSAAAFADDEIIGATIVITGGTGAGQSRVITDYVSSTDTATVDTWTTTPSGTITYAIFGTAPASATSPIAANVIQISGDSTAADNLEADYDGTGYAKTNSTVGTVTTLTGHTAQTGDSFARLGAPAGASVSADVAAVKSETASILVDTGTTLEGHLTDIKGATFSGTTDSLEAIRDRGDAAWTTGSGGTPPQLLQSTTIATLATQTSFTLTAGSSDDDAYNGAIVVITDASTSEQKAVGSVSDYTGSTKTVTLAADPAIFTMAVGDTVEIIAALGSAGSAPTAAQIRAEIDANSTQLAAIVADTNELQGDWANGGRLDLILDARASQASVDVMDALVDAIKAVTDLLPDAGALTSIAQASALATVDGIVDQILVDTGTTVPALIAALNDLDAAGIRTAVGLASANLDTQLADIPTNAELAARTLLAAAYATASNQTTIDTAVDAIKSKTDSLTFTKAGEVDSNTQSINGVTLTGDGSASPFDV